MGAAILLTGVIGALLLATQPSLPWRGAMVALTLAFAWRPIYEMVYARGRNGIRYIELTGGTWHIGLGSGARERAELLPASGGLGPWLFLFWAGEKGARRCALVDAGYADPRAFRALKGWLRLGVAWNPHRRRAGGDNC